MWKFITTRNFLMEQASDDGGAGGTGSSLLGGTGGSTPPADKGTPPPADKGSEGGKGSDESWLTALPDDLKEDATLKNFKDIKSLAAAHVALKKHLGADKIALPGKNATAEDWKALYTKLGVPEKVDDYKVEFKKEAVITDDFAKEFRTKLHSVGILPQQAQALADWVSETNITNTKKFSEDRAKQQQAEIGELRKEWGNAFDTQVARANKLLAEHADEATVKYLQSSGLGNDVRLIKLLAAAGGALYKEDKALEGQGQGTAKLTPAEARAEANKIVADFKHPYHIKDHPNHKSAVEEVAKLFEQAASQG